MISQWSGIPPSEWPNTGRMFSAYVTTVPLTLLTIASLFAAWSSPEPLRTWYLAAAGIVIVERIDTSRTSYRALARHCRGKDP